METTENSVGQEELCRQVQTIDATMCYLLLIVAGLLLTYYATAVQRKQLICTVCPSEDCRCLPDVFPIRLIASLMILAALIFFFHQSCQASSQPAADCVRAKSNCTNSAASALVLAAALVRLGDLLFVHRCAS